MICIAIITSPRPRNFSKILKKVKNLFLSTSLVKIYVTDENQIKVATAIYIPKIAKGYVSLVFNTTPNKVTKNNNAFTFEMFVINPVKKPPILLHLLLVNSTLLKSDDLDNEIIPRYAR